MQEIIWSANKREEEQENKSRWITPQQLRDENSLF